MAEKASQAIPTISEPKSSANPSSSSSTGRPRGLSHIRQAPSLFVGPPSRNASAADLHKGSEPASKRVPLNRQRSAMTGQVDGSSTLAVPGEDGSRLSAATAAAAATTTTATATSRDQMDAVWAEMQNTLEEVELNAAGGANVFSREHARALEELRKAQVELAQAWTRSEGDDEPLEATDGATLGRPDASRRDGLEHSSSSILADERTAKMSTHNGRQAGEVDKTRLEQETENDIRLARRRRQANDKYFERVNKGVVDVVQKLMVVAERMREVEDESQSVWSDRASTADGASVT